MPCSDPRPQDVVRDIRFARGRMHVALADGRTISVPLTFYPLLAEATPAQRANWKLADEGCGIHWPDLDEDIGVGALLAGTRDTKSPSFWRRWRAEVDRRFPAGQATRKVRSPRAAKRNASLSSAALPGRRKRKPAASRTKSVTSRTRKSGLKTKR